MSHMQHLGRELKAVREQAKRISGRGGKRAFKVTEVGEGLVCSGSSKEAHMARVEGERRKVASDEVIEQWGPRRRGLGPTEDFGFILRGRCESFYTEESHVKVF